MNDPNALANALALRQDKERKIKEKIKKSSPQLASKLQAIRETHAVRREALLHSISQLDEELAQSEATLTQESSSLKVELRKRLRRLEEKDERDRKAMSVATLPDEMLAEIFKHCVDGDTGEQGREGLGFSPRVLALVSRRWYQVAITTAPLWCTILVTDKAAFYWKISRNSMLGRKTISHPKPCERMHSALQVCTTAAELEGALGRTRNARLNITIGFSCLDRNLYSQLCKILFNDHVTPRIMHLALEAGSAPKMEASLLEYMTTSVHLLSNLVCLTTTFFLPWELTSEEKIILQLVLENAKNLKYLYPIDSRVDECLKADVWQETSYASTLQNLRQLRVKNGEVLAQMFSDVMPIPEIIIEDAAKVERAEERKMWDIDTWAWPKSSTREMRFTQVTRMHLILDDISFLSLLTFPVLEHLRLTQSSTSHRRTPTADIEPLFIPNFVMDLPKLRTLQITARHFSPVNRFILPRLQSFHMTSTHSVKGKIDADFSQLFCLPAVAPGPLVEESEATNTGMPTTCPFQSITTLYVNANVSEKLLIQALKGLPLLEVLRLVPGKKISQVLIRELTVEKSRSFPKVKEILCPALEIIELDLVSFGEWDRAFKFEIRVGTTTLGGFSGALHKCVASRRKASKPLGRCTVISQEGRLEFVES